MTLAIFVLAAILLSFERLGYAFAWRYPEAFRRRCAELRLAKDPVTGLERLFYVFKLVQILVFVGWIAHVSGDRFPCLSKMPAALWVGVALIVVGQALNVGTFVRLGRTGIFYGVRFGHATSWCRGFPFNIVDHPQYVGTVLTIWGVFVAVRFPEPDWFLLPVLQTIYYTLGAHFENHAEAATRPSA